MTTAWSNAPSQASIHTHKEVPVAKGQIKREKSNKPKLTPKEKAAKKMAKKQAKGI